MAVLLLFGALVLFGYLAVRYGADSRDGGDWARHEEASCAPC
jgi:hypothetical protein